MQMNVSVSEKYTYEQLQQKYIDFSHPRARVLLGDKAFDSVGGDMIVDDIHVELSSGYEASVASFRIYDSYDPNKGRFKFDQIRKQIAMGNALDYVKAAADAVTASCDEDGVALALEKYLFNME